MRVINRAVTKRVSHLFFSVVRLIFLILIGYMVLYPLLYMVSYAGKSSTALLDMEHIWVPKTYTLEHYKEVIDMLSFGSSLVRTLLFQLLSAAVEVLVCAFIAYGFARFKFKGKAIFSAFLILSLLVPIQMYSMGLAVNFRTFHIYNTPFVYWLPSLLGVGVRSGMMIFIYQQFFAGLPVELEDAAYIDGAGPVRTFFRIALPSSGVVITAVGMLAFVWFWNEYHLASLTFQLDNGPLSLQMYFLIDLLENRGNYGVMRGTVVSAACVLFISIPLLFYMIFQRQFVRSIDRVGITG